MKWHKSKEKNYNLSIAKPCSHYHFNCEHISDTLWAWVYNSKSLRAIVWFLIWKPPKTIFMTKPNSILRSIDQSNHFSISSNRWLSAWMKYTSIGIPLQLELIYVNCAQSKHKSVRFKLWTQIIRITHKHRPALRIINPCIKSSYFIH